MTNESGWQLDHEGAMAYERNLVPVFMDGWAVDLLDAVGAGPGARVLDVGCGTGIVARHAARRVGADGAVTGVDINPGMLSAARELVAQAGLDVELKEADAGDLPFPDATFDVTTCQQAFQFVPDRAAALAEMARVTVPGGRVGVGICRSIDHQPGYRVLADVIARQVGVPAAEILRSPYAGPDRATLRGLFEGAGLRAVHVGVAVWTARFDSPSALLRAETSSSPLGDIWEGLDGDVREALVDGLTAELDEWTDDDGVVFPFSTLVATATR